jgi:hypothetical protein
MTTLRAPRHTRRLLRWTFRHGTRLLSCQLHTHAGFFSLALVPLWDTDDAVIERFERAVDAFREHAATATRLRQLGWELVSYSGGAPSPAPDFEELPAVA